MADAALLGRIFQDYDQIRQGQQEAGRNSRETALIGSWNRYRMAHGFPPGRNNLHTCTHECEIDLISPPIHLYGCRASGYTHKCSDGADCEMRYTDGEGYEFCVFSMKVVDRNIVVHAWTNPNTNRTTGRLVFRAACSPPSSSSPLPPFPPSPLLEKGDGGRGLNMGTPLRTPFSGAGGTPLLRSIGESTPNQVVLCSPFDLASDEDGVVLGQTPAMSTPVAATPRRRISSGLALHATLSNSLPDYTKTTIKGKPRKSTRKRKASNPKRDVKRNEWAQDVKKRACEHLKHTQFFGHEPKKSEWETEDEDEENTYGGICLFTVDVPLYRGYTRDIVYEDSLSRGQRNRMAWIGGLFRIKSGSEIESRTDDILRDLLWDNDTKERVYKKRLEDAKREALSEIEAYVKNQINAKPSPLLPNYYVLSNRWMHALDHTIPEPTYGSVDDKHKTFYRLLVLALWAFMWEYIEVPAWRSKCHERVRKLESTHMGVISPSLTNIPVQPGVSHIQFTTGVLYTLRQDGILLDTECVLPPDEWLTSMLPSPAELGVELSPKRAPGRTVFKKQQQDGKYGVTNSGSSGRKAGSGGTGRKRRRKRGGRGKRSEGFGRGKRAYTQSNVTEGRNYVKKGLLQLTREGHSDHFKTAVLICQKQAENIHDFQGF